MEVALAIEDGGDDDDDLAADVGGAETGDEEPDGGTQPAGLTDFCICAASVLQGAASELHL